MFYLIASEEKRGVLLFPITPCRGGMMRYRRTTDGEHFGETKRALWRDAGEHFGETKRALWSDGVSTLERRLLRKCFTNRENVVFFRGTSCADFFRVFRL